MNNFKRIIGAFLGVIMSLGIANATPAIAETVDEAIVDEVTPRDVNKPTKETTLPYTANLYDLWAGKGTYTLYSFKTSTGELNLDWSLCAVRPSHGRRSMIIDLYKKDGNSWRVVDYQYLSFTDEDADDFDGRDDIYTGSVSFTNLSSDEIYCMRFNNTSSENTGSTSLHNSISKSIIISD